jgi:hypothetical protein
MRISATILESFRRMLNEEEELADQIESDLIAKLKGEFVWTPEMRLGSAYHAILERPQRALSGYYEADGFQFEPVTVEAMLEQLFPGGTFEAKTTREILVPGFGFVTLVAKADHLYGADLDEFKTTLGSFDAETYTESYQWRMMALLFEPVRINYRVALLSADRQTGIIGLRSIEQVQVYPYPDLERDVRNMVKEFCHYARTKGLESYLEPKFPVVTS